MILFLLCGIAVAADDFSPERLGGQLNLLRAGTKPMDKESVNQLQIEYAQMLAAGATGPVLQVLEEEKRQREIAEKELQEAQARAAVLEETRIAAEAREREALLIARAADQRTAEVETAAGLAQRSAIRRQESLERHLEEIKTQKTITEKELGTYAQGLRLSIGEAKLLLAEILRFQEENYALRQGLGQSGDALPIAPQDFLTLTRQVVVLASQSTAQLSLLYPEIEKFKARKN
ncbi:MAG: hypothetical protein AAB323_01475 [Pseudomonadota bacterium]